MRDSDKCKYCTERKRLCIRGNAFRFRPVKTVKFNAGEDIGSAEQSLEFGAGQTWVEIPRACKLVSSPSYGPDSDLRCGTSQIGMYAELTMIVHSALFCTQYRW